jgi:hypothetical protein
MYELLAEVPEIEVTVFGEQTPFFEPVAAACCSSIVSCCCCS